MINFRVLKTNEQNDHVSLSTPTPHPPDNSFLG